MTVNDILKDVPDDLPNTFSNDLESPLCVPQDRIEDIELYSIFIDGFDLHPDHEIDVKVKIEEEEEARPVHSFRKRVAPLEGCDGFSNKRQRSKREIKAKPRAWSINNVCFTVKSEKSDDESTRKCSHCETTETPQWRTGQNGPKTLCNACGVRYKSGRLFPEYRPAASPTFDCRRHSNFHRKIMKKRSGIIY
ncbi:hypothetical protein Ddye_009353 [Dipteronia dyeriana]|uniref:GATA-type domain-containing protein n=1 Tax=Dipteronia dyeriana TaxID=168575 RepID=A0AAD9XBV7_9ROSI|nr:hypothetical protein Ddye_009353 [Dipteronia dyeriana]